MRPSELLAPDRATVLVHAAFAVVGAVVCFVPLFNLIGYESAALFGVLGGVASLVLTSRRYRDELPMPIRAEDAPTVQWARATAQNLMSLIVPFALLGANATRVENCDVAGGVAFWVTIPVASIAIGSLLGIVVGQVFWRRRWGLRAGAFLVFAASVVDFGLRLALQPPINGYHVFLGYFSGSIYDEALAVPDGLVAYRIIQLVGCGAILAFLEWKWREGRVRPLIVAASLLALLWAGLFAERDRWGVDRTSSDVAKALGGRAESQNFIIFYPADSRFDAAEVARMVEDHEFRYAEMRAFFGTDPVAESGEKVVSFVYADRAQKGVLIGARRTLVAKIWLGEMHILWREYGDHMLAHELAHVFTEPFASGPLRLSTRYGVGINMGLVEGAATAADWHSAELSPHESSAALQRLDRAPDLRRLVGASGFWTQSSGRAYTLVGSFIRYLVETRGIEKFRQAYPHGEFEAAYGASVDDLVAEWEAYLATIAIDEEKMERARFLYDRPTIFEKVCARKVGELRVTAFEAIAAGQTGVVVDAYGEVLEHAPNHVGYRVEFAQTLLLLDAFDEARAEVGILAERDDLTPAETAQMLHLMGDIAWREGRVTDAAEAYRAALSSGLPVEYERLLTAKLESVTRDERARYLARSYLVSRADRADALYYPVTWRAEAPDDPLAAYLVGRRLWAAHQHEEAIPHLEAAAGRLPGALDSEAKRLLGISHYWVGSDDAARRVFSELAEHPRSTFSVEAAEWLARIEWRARNTVQGRGG